MKNPLLAVMLGWLGRLRHPYLFAIAGLVFLVDLAVPDFVPFVDEIVLAAITAWIGSRKSKKTPPLEPEAPAK